MNSEEITSTEAQTLESAYTSNPYSTGASTGFSLPVSTISTLLSISQSATIAIYWGRDNGNLTGIVVAASNSDGSILTGTGYYSNGQAVSQSAAETLMSSYNSSKDADTSGKAVYFERTDIQTIISATGASTADFSFARETDDSLNIVATNDLGTVYFNRSKPKPY